LASTSQTLAWIKLYVSILLMLIALFSNVTFRLAFFFEGAYAWVHVVVSELTCRRTSHPLTPHVSSCLWTYQLEEIFCSCRARQMCRLDDISYINSYLFLSSKNISTSRVYLQCICHQYIHFLPRLTFLDEKGPTWISLCFIRLGTNVLLLK